MPVEDFEQLSPANFDKFIAENDAIIICHKPLCPHCRIMATVLDKAKAMRPELVLGAVDSLAQPELLASLEVERVPTLCAIKNGKVAGRHSGVMNPMETLDWWESV